MCGLIALTALFLPALEIYVLIEVGARIGAAETLFLVFATAALGLWAARGQSLRALDRVRRGQVPQRAEVLEGPLLLLAALCLLVPGFVTDSVGALLLLPPVRRRLARAAVQRFGRPGPGGPPDGPAGPGSDAPEIIVVPRRP